MKNSEGFKGVQLTVGSCLVLPTSKPGPEGREFTTIDIRGKGLFGHNIFYHSAGLWADTGQLHEFQKFHV
jgi:hypothetical protein